MRTSLLSAFSALAVPTLLVAQAPTGPELAAQLRVLRTTTDTAVLRHLLAGAVAVTDSAIYGAALEVGADAGATPEARITSLGVLLAYEKDGFYVSYRGLAAPPLSPEFCVGLGGSDFHSVRLTPLPPDQHTRTRDLATAILSDSATPPTLRNAARCLHIASEVRRTAVPVDPSLIQLSNVCGTTFRVRNGNPRVVTVIYQVEGTAERWDSLWVAAQPDSLPYGETQFRTQVTGTVQLLYNGQVIQTVANGGTPCPL